MKISKIIKNINNISFKEKFLAKRKRLYISLGILAVAATATALMLFFGGKDTLAAWWDESWAFRRRISVTNNTTAETDVYIIISNVDTSDTTRFQADCGDIRFTKENGQLLDYYIVSGCGTATTTLHVQFDTLIAGLQDIYMYYGNPSAANGFAGNDFSTQASSYSVGSLAAEEKSQGPVAFWKFDEGYGTTPQDSGPNNYDGSFTDSPVWKDENQCVSGKCLYFDGTTSTDRVDMTLNNYSSLTKSVSISFWYRATNDDDGWDGILNINGGYSSGTRFLTRKDINNRVDWQANYGDATPRILSTGALNIGEWHFITATYDGQNATLYLDGKYVNSYSETRDLVLSSALQIGYAQYYFQGFIDEPKIYSYARSAAQIKTDYISRSSIKGASTVLGGGSNKWLSDGLVGYWKMDESSWTNDCTATSVADSSGNGNNGSACPASTGPTGGAAGKFGNGGTLDGSDDYIKIPTSSMNGLTDFSVSYWMKTSDTTKSGTGLHATNTGNNEFIAFEYRNLAIYVKDTSWSSGVALNNGEWRLVTITRVSGTGQVKLFVDGSLQGTTTLATGALNTSGCVVFGQEQDAVCGGFDPAQAFLGSVDELRIYNRALSPKEASDLYSWAPGPIGYWNFDEGSGGSVNDKSGNGVNGTWNGSGSHWTSGKYGKAGKFNAASVDYVRATGSIMTAADNTISFWLKAPVQSGNYKRIFSDATNGIEMYFTGTGTNGLYGTIGNSTSGWIMQSPDLADNEWYYISLVSTASDGNTRAYLDGNLISTTNKSYSSITLDDLYIGIESSGSVYPLEGSIDDVKVYNYARSTKQIVEDMNAGHPAVGSPVGSAVGNWKFDEGYGNTTYNSGSGTGINGTITGATWSSAGKFGKTLNFSGTSTYVDMGNTSPLQITSDLTISSWIYLSNVDPTYARGIVSKFYNTNGNRGYRLGITNSTGLLSFAASNDGTTSVQVTGNTAIPTNTWTYVSATYRASAGAVDFYINGKMDTTKTGLATSIYNVGKNFQIGTWDTSTSNHSFVGLIDEVKIYNSALTADEIKLDYNRGAAMVMGATSTDSSGNPDNSSAREYCIPGDTTSCSAPVAEWKMDEKTGQSINDTSDNNTVGTLGSSGGTDTNDPAWASAKFGGGLNFDGTNDYVDLGITPSALSFITGRPNVSFSAWIKPDLINDYDGVICNSIDGGATGQRFCLTLQTTNRLRFLVGNSASYQSLYSATNSLTSNQWQHVAVTMDSSNNVRIYVNGQLSNGNQTLTVDLETSSASWKIGAAFNNPSAYQFDGVMDNLKIYDYTLTPAQIAWDYNRGAPVGHWKFDECQGTTANDSSGNGNNGTITIGATVPQTAEGTCTTAGTAWGNGATGKFNSSLNFDGTDDYVSITTNVSLPKITISSWIKTTSSSDQYITERNNSSFYLRTVNGTVCFWLAGASANWLCTTQTVHDGNWHHIIGSYDGADKKIYIDGTFVTSIAGSGDITPASSAINIGVRINSGVPASYFNGQIDDVRIYNYGMTATQIKTLYNDGAVRFGPETGSP